MKRNLVCPVTVAAIAAVLSACAPNPSAPSSTPPAVTATATATPQAVTPAVEPVPAPSSTSAAPEVYDEPEEAPPLPVWDASAEDAAIARAEGFVRAWARPDLDPTSWFAGVQGFLSPAAWGMYEAVDPLMVPATAVTGPGRVQGEPSGTAVSVLVPTDAGELLVQLVRATAEDAWLVAQMEQAGEAS